MQLRHAQNAMASQSACNVSGLVHSLSKLIDEIWTEAREAGEGTEYVNTHPVVVMFTTQLAHLSGCGIVDTSAYSKAYNAVNDTLNAAANKEASTCP